jgi:putative transcriptional regulator
MKNRLKVLRAERDWTQARLADALDVSRQTVNAIETGKFDPSLPLAFRAARLFGLRIEEIFHDPALDVDPRSLATEIKKDTYV